MTNYQERLLKVIPGGAHTYSRGADQFPANAPQMLVCGKGAYVRELNGKQYLDYGMALRSVAVGYAEPSIVEAAHLQIRNGNNLTLPTWVELHAAERFVELIGCDMVKFTKNGSTAVTAAVKLARAYTGRDIVARCADHPFFSYDDWFIGSTSRPNGVTRGTINDTKQFRYNDLRSLEVLLGVYHGQVACVVLEPATTEAPKPGYLEGVQALCKKHGAILIFDEMITGFRWHLNGAQHLYGVKPDLCTFGKAMANGFSVACVAGKRDLMQLGANGVFLASTTHGAEMSGMGAFTATVALMKRLDVVSHLWTYGRRLIDVMNDLAAAHGIAEHFKAGGIPCSPIYTTLDADGKVSLAFRTLFMQEMVKAGVLMPWIALCFRHQEAELDLTVQALDRAFAVYRQALTDGIDKYLEGPVIKPVFRKCGS